MKIVFLLGSKSDEDFSEEMIKELKAYGLETEMHIASAHKVPEKVYDIVSKNNEGGKDMIYVTVAGRSNGLSGVVAANSVHPVIACPPFKDKDDFIININSTLVMPSDTPVMTVIDRQNVVMAVLRIVALKDGRIKEEIENRIRDIKEKFN